MLKYEEVQISELNLNPNNPRINDEAAKKLRKGLDKYGFINPVIVNSRDNMVLAGHARIKAMDQMGHQSIPVLFVDMDEATARGFSLWDNKSAEFAEWDDELVALEIDAMSELDFDLWFTGFNPDELSSLSDEFSVDPCDMPDLPSGDKEPFQQKTFTLHDDQAGVVDDAIMKARTNPSSDTGINENSNGNALALICKEWLEK